MKLVSSTALAWAMILAARTATAALAATASHPRVVEQWGTAEVTLRSTHRFANPKIKFIRVFTLDRLQSGSLGATDRLGDATGLIKALR